MSQIYPKIESSEKVVDSRQMLLDRDDANRTNNSGQTAPANVTPNDIGMTWFNTQDGLMYNLVSVEEDGSNPVWQKMANFNSFNVMNLGVLQEEALFVDLEGPACDAKADMLVLVEHTMLPTENYEITQDGARVTFLQPIEAGLHLELRWFTKVIIARDGKTFVPSLVDGVLSWENDGGLPNPEPFDFNVAQASVVAEGNKQVTRVQQTGDSAVSSISDAKDNFNANATTKTNEFDDNYTDKLGQFNNNAEEKQNLVDAGAEEARKWAVGTIEERVEGSSKYWAEKAENSAASVDANTIKKIAYENIRTVNCSGETTVNLQDTDEVINLIIQENSDITFDASQLNFSKYFYTVQVVFTFSTAKTISLKTNLKQIKYVNDVVPDFSNARQHWLVLRINNAKNFLLISDAGIG